MRNVYAAISANIGRSQHRQFPVKAVSAYTFEQAMDNDSDSFSIDIADKNNALKFLYDRDTEVQANIFLRDRKDVFQPMFTGISDVVTMDSGDMQLSLQGRDLSSLALTDALPGKWKHVKPAQFITDRARKVGLTNIRIHAMSEISPLYTDGSETEWAFWYRMVRQRDYFMWTEDNGRLVIDKLHYGLSPQNFFGRPPRGANRAGWLMPERVSITKSTTGRAGEVWVYGADAKHHQVFAARGVDTSIRAWRRLPIRIIQDSAVKSNADAKKRADSEVFETIVGAFEIELTMHDTGLLIKQNTMARLNIPELELVGNFFVVGVRSQGSMDGQQQIVRLRQKGFALSKRVSDAPTLVTESSTSDQSSTTSLSKALAQSGSVYGVRWADSFVRATNEFGVKAGWDFGVFLGVLLAMCEKESGFKNEREGGSDEWEPFDLFLRHHHAANKVSGPSEVRALYEQTYANKAGSTNNPFSREAGAGPMQLTSSRYKDWADQYGWSGKPKKDEFEGGRWNPDSNIRAAARALVEKLQIAPAADPNTPDSIWLGVTRYNGGGATAQAYAADVKKRYESKYQSIAEGAVTTATKLPAGSLKTAIKIPGYGQYEVIPSAPDAIKKAINFIERRLGDKYLYGGAGPLYDCSSMVTAALASADSHLRDILDEPDGKSHGESTYSLFRKGRFPAVNKDSLLPGDLIFYHHDGGVSAEHVTMYLGEGLQIGQTHTGSVCKTSSIHDQWYADHYLGARRLVQWYGTDGSTAGSGSGSGSTSGSSGTKKVMIQAGHDTGSHSDQPFGHTGESGAVGEQDFTKEVRDKVLALLDGDPNFVASKGTAWDASAGATASTSDDIDYNGDLFISVHYDKGTAGSGFFFGFTRGPTDSRRQAMADGSAKLADSIAARMNNISGHPPRLTDNSTFGGSPANSTGWGYYAWGSSLRASPNDVNHLPNANAALVMECGRASDASFLDNKRAEIAKAIYRGICDYYGFKVT